MKIYKLLLATLFMLLFTGCDDYIIVCSLNPFYTPDNIITDSAIEGKWKTLKISNNVSGGKTIWYKNDTSLLWKIERKMGNTTIRDIHGRDSATVAAPKDYYMVHIVSENKDSLIADYKLVLFRVKGVVYADLMPVNDLLTSNSRLAKDSYIVAHTLARLKTRGNTQTVSWLSDQTMREMIEDKHVRAKYKYNNDRLMLTGSPEQLTAMIERYATEKRFVDWDQQPAMLNLVKIN